MGSYRLHYHKERVKKDGQVSLYPMVIANRMKAEIPLNISWPIDKVDLVKEKLKQRFRNDDDYRDNNLIAVNSRFVIVSIIVILHLIKSCCFKFVPLCLTYYR